MNLMWAVSLTPYRTVTTMRMALILIAQEIRELQGVLSSVNQVMTHLMRKTSITEKGVTLYLQVCQKFKQR